MTDKKRVWHKIAGSTDEIIFASNGIAELAIAGKTVCIVKQQDQLRACSAKCPHASGILANGYVDALGHIVCPLHRYKFSLQNGRNVSGEGYFLKTFPVEIRNEGVFIGFEENNLFNW
jgi:nitrite reductase/ring-hydroxylating ferredoxin subunit